MTQPGLTTAMILAAGRGSRLAPLTDTTPKPLLEVHGQPLIEHQLGWLRRAGIRRVVINLFHLGEQIRERLGDGARFGMEIAYSVEPTLLETGGGIVHARPLLGSAPFLLLNGDIWTNFDFTSLPRTLAAHLQGQLMVVPTPPNRDTGDFALAHHRLRRPAARQQRTWVYCGIAVLRPSITGRRQGAFSLRDPLFDSANSGLLAGAPLALPAATTLPTGRSPTYWSDIGTLDELERVRQTNP